MKKRVFALILSALLLSACGAAPKAVPAAPPSAPVPTPSAAQTPQPPAGAVKLPYDFNDWRSRHTLWSREENEDGWSPPDPEAKPRWLSGVMVKGRREGNSLSLSLDHEKDDARYQSLLRLKTPAGEYTTLFPSLLTLESKYRYADLQCADLDGDGTDEIILCYSCGSSGGEGDLHVYRIEDTGLVEILAYWDDTWGDLGTLASPAPHQPLPAAGRCVGYEVFLREEGLALRVYYSMDAWEYGEGFARLYGEFALTRTGWQTLNPNIVETSADRLQALQKALSGRVVLDENYSVYRSCYGAGANLTGSAVPEDQVYCATASSDGGMGPGYMAIETRLKGEEQKLSLLYGPKDGMNGYVQIMDLDGDGRDELVAALSYTQTTEEEGAGAAFELHVLKYQRGGFEDVLTILKNAPEAAGEHANTLFTLENTAGLEIPPQEWANSLCWGYATILNGLPCLCLTHQYGDMPDMYSYVAFERGAWGLIAQSPLSLE